MRLAPSCSFSLSIFTGISVKKKVLKVFTLLDQILKI